MFGQDPRLAFMGSVFKSGYRSNAFAPLVWFNVVSIPALLTAAYHLDGWSSHICLGLVGLIIIGSIIGYFVLLMKDPKLLQGERYRLEDKRLDIIANKGGDIEIDPVDITRPIMLPGKDGDNKEED